VKLKLNAKFQT